MHTPSDNSCCGTCSPTPFHNLLLSLSTALIFAMGLAMQYADTEFFATAPVRFGWYLVAYLPVALPVLREAWQGLRRGEFFTEYTLMSLATLGAFYIGEYPEGVAVMLFYSVGEGLQERAVERARRNIRKLVDIRPVQATVLQDGVSVTQPAVQIVPGQTIEVLPGSRVPLDGILLTDTAPFNTSALTGESMPRTIRRGESVLAGMISEEQAVQIEVTRPYGESALSRILAMVEQAAARKAPAELFIRRFARIYTPVVTGLAVLIVTVPWLWSLLHGSFVYSLDEWLARALVFLVASCPCALVISIPLGYFSGISAASKAGILFKGGNFLDIIARVNTVLFDKTGTLTEGLFKVQEIKPVLGINSRELVRLAASAEQRSTHPVARALVRYAAQEGIVLPAPTESSEIAGHGICARVEDRQLLLGNTRLLNRFGVQYPTEIDHIPETIVLCAIDDHYAGYMMIADSPKADAAQAVAALRALDINDIRILSGDRQSLVEKLGHTLGVNHASGDLLPEGKVAILEELQKQPGKVTAFVGDGFNDAPALAMSNLSVAMGGLGSDAAIETADVVIQSDEPSRLAIAVRIGRFTHLIIRQNILLAVGVKIVVLTLGAVGVATMWEAVFADVGVTLLAVLNAVRSSGRKF